MGTREARQWKIKRILSGRTRPRRAASMAQRSRLWRGERTVIIPGKDIKRVKGARI